MNKYYFKPGEGVVEVLGTVECAMLKVGDYIWEPSTQDVRCLGHHSPPPEEGAIRVNEGDIVKVNGHLVVLEDAYTYFYFDPNCIDGWRSVEGKLVELPTPEELDKAQKLIKLVEEAKQMLRTAYEGGISPYSALKREDWMPSSC